MHQLIHLRIFLCEDSAEQQDHRRGSFPFLQEIEKKNIYFWGKFELTGKGTITEFKPNSIRSHALQII